jgi:catechol 2,3-dioxygenase
MRRDSDLELGGIEAPRDPEELEAAAMLVDAEISPLTTVGAVHLTVSNLDRSVDYHRRIVGLELLERSGGQASLGCGGRELLGLFEERGARSGAGYTGLYHFALLVPHRVDLARWLAHAVHGSVSLTGLSDHFVSEAIYLSDPDGHGIEIYRDRPRDHWEGQVGARMTTLPLDVRSLLGELADPATEPFERLPEDTIMGHVHLKVAAIGETITFYRDLLRFGLMAKLGFQAAFFSAGGYHHHLGANTWESAGANPPPARTAALRHATIVLPDRDTRDTIQRRLEEAQQPTHETDEGPVAVDPAGNRLLLAGADAT